MKIGIQSGFNGDLLGVELMRQIELRFDMARVEVFANKVPMFEVVEAGMTPLCLIRHLGHIHGFPVATNVEFGNEPDLEANGWTLETYTNAVLLAALLAEKHGLNLWIGAVSNLNERGLDFLSALPWKKLPMNVSVSFHRYPHGDKPTNAHRGFKSREDEVVALKQIIGKRRFGVSEVGYSTQKRRHRVFWSKRWTNEQVAEHMAFEKAFWKEQGAAFCIGYQLNDSPTEFYGFRDVQGNWKPVSQTFSRLTL